MWANRAWVGPYFPTTTRSGDELATYATWCTTVEGNTTFYSVPPASTVSKWADLAPETFRFCFKLPRTITHDRRLRGCSEELAAFLTTIEPLGPRIGPIQIQLPASFEPDDMSVLKAFVSGLPHGFTWAVEVRHLDFFAGGEAEAPLDDLLSRSGINRVILDSRALFDGPAVTEEEIDAWTKKPRVPVRPVATADQPIVRLIGQTEAAPTRERWQPWIPVIARWIEEGREPHVFTHTPDNRIAPEHARWFFDQVAALVPTLEPLPEPETDATQLDLF